MVIFTDTFYFLSALSGEYGELRRAKAKQIVWHVRRRIISGGEAAEEFFERESNDVLFIRVMRALRDESRGGAVHKILNAASVPMITTERAVEDLIYSTAIKKDKQ